MTYKGKYLYWGVEGTKYSGDPSADQNIPFNPIANLEPQKPRYVDEEFRTFNNLTPHSTFSNELGPGEGPFETNFRDPFLLLAFFPHKTVGGVWGTGDGTIAADFTDTDDVDTIWAQYQLEDLIASNDLNRLLKGGFPMKYSWLIEPGKLLKEMADVKFVDFEDNTQAMSCSNDFHDQSFGSGVGGWANWDNSGLNGTGKRSVTDMVLKWGGSVLTGLQIKNMEFSFEVGSETEQIYSSLSHTVDYFQPQNLTLTLDGFLYDKTLVAEYEQIISDRTSQTLQLYYDATVGYEKYLQSTNVKVSGESSVEPIAESGKVSEVQVIMKGDEKFALSFMGTYLDRPDPSVLITTSP